MEESEQRRERLKAMRMEASQTGVHNEIGNSVESHQLSNPLIETSAATPVQMNSYATPRFDYYTDPMSAFSANKRRSKVSNQNSPDYFTPPRPRNPETTPSLSHQFLANYSPDRRMYQARGPYLSAGPRNPEMTSSPVHQVQTNYSPDQRMYQARGPHHSSGPRNPEMTPSPAHQIQTNYLPDQRMYQAQGPYDSSTLYGSPIGMVSPFSPHQGAPGVWNGSTGTPSFYPQTNPLGVANISSPGFGGSPSLNSGQGRGHWFSNSPGSGSGYGGSPSSNLGRGRGRWSGNNMRPGLGRGGQRGLGSHGGVSAEFRPDLYYNQSMVEDPWKLLKPIVWRRENILNTPDSLRSVIPKSVGIKKARISEASNASSSQPSLAEYLAAAFNETVNDEASNDKPSL